MACKHCEHIVKEALDSVNGVSVGRKSERANVKGDADETELVQAVEDAGYTART